MRKILNRMSACAAAALALVSCVKEMEVPAGTAGGDNIILDIASESLPLTRAEASGAEIAVDHLDVLIFGEDGSWKWNERIASMSAVREGSVVLAAKREDFDAGVAYWVYLVANSAHPAEDFSGIDLNGLRAMIEQTRYIYLTGWEGSPSGVSVPQTFLMDGIAYPGEAAAEPENAAAVVLNNGTVSDDTELKVTLRRAAAKIVVNIAKGDEVEFLDSGNDGFYLSNMPWTTSVISGVDAPAELRTPDLFRFQDTPFYEWTTGGIKVMTYAYAHEWADASALENEVRLVVNIPLRFGEQEYPDSYYQIPVSRDKILKRNTYYEVSVTVNTPGATDPSEPLLLEDIRYDCYDWTEKTIDIGGEIEDAAYLSLNRYELEMHNITDDNTSLVFASSSEVSVSVDRVWYIDKFGQEQVTTGSWPISNLGVSADADPGLNGNLSIHSDLPNNNTIRYIQLTVSNEDGIEREVLIRQYPLEYITNIQSWYSYRDDFGGTTYELLNGVDPTGVRYDDRVDERYVGCSWDNNGKWEYSNSGDNKFFGSKVATQNNDGTFVIRYYQWNAEGHGGWIWPDCYTYSCVPSGIVSGLDNARMYHVQITASSDQYTLGIPRRNADGLTDRGADNAELVSPSFMIASQLGAVLAARSVEEAGSHCNEYVEVYKDEETGETIHLNDWRLPTKAEIEIIIRFQYAENAAMDVVLSGDKYWSASGLVDNPGGSSTAGAIRCIRDVYGD